MTIVGDQVLPGDLSNLVCAYLGRPQIDKTAQEGKGSTGYWNLIQDSLIQSIGQETYQILFDRVTLIFNLPEKTQNIEKIIRLFTSIVSSSAHNEQLILAMGADYLTEVGQSLTHFIPTAEICKKFFSLTEEKEFSKILPRIHNIKGNRLDLSGLSLTHLPLELAFFPSLKVLNLNDNKLKDFSGLRTLKQLNNLQIKRNGLIEIPAEIVSSTSLAELDLASNKISKVRDRITQLVSLAVFTVSDNSLEDSSFPDGMKAMVNLKKIHAVKNKIDTTPDAIKAPGRLVLI